MAYRRRILHYSSNCNTLIQVLSDEQDPNASRCISAWFELHRLGGCGAAEVTLKDRFTLREDIEINDYIAFEYDVGQRWYFGRVEEVQAESPKGVRLSIYGQWSELSEVYPGGYGDSGVGTPVRFARSDWFPRDPDHALQAWFTADTPNEVADLLWTYYIAPATCVGIRRIESPTPPIGIDSFTFRGEESAAEVLRNLALIAKSASVGVDMEGTLYFLQKRATILDTFQEGVDIEHLETVRDKQLLYNGLLITGDNIYTPANIGVYRYRSFWWQYESKQRYGLRVMKAYVPWIRRHADAKAFADEFFRQYAHPTTRVTLRTNVRSRLLRPWDGQLRIRDYSGQNITVDQFDSIKVNFDHGPTFEITVGPEDIQYPRTPEDQRREIPESAGDGEDSNSASISSQSSFSGTVSLSGTASLTVPTSITLTDLTSGSGTIRCFTRIARVAATQDAAGETAWLDGSNILSHDSVEASAAPGVGGTSGYLIGRDFGFTTAEVPDSATVVGVIVEAVVRATLDGGASDFVQDEQIRLFIPGTGIAGDNNAGQTHWPTTAEWKSWGSSLYTWGISASLMPANVRNPQFGAAIKIDTTGPTENAAYIDVMQVTVCVSYASDSSDSNLGDDACSGGYDTFNDAEGTALADHVPDIDTGGDGWSSVSGGLVISDPGDNTSSLRLPGAGTGAGTAYKLWGDSDCRIRLGCNLGSIGSGGVREFVIVGKRWNANNYVSLDYVCGEGGGNGTLTLSVYRSGVATTDTATVAVPAYATLFDMYLEMRSNTFKGWVNKSPSSDPDVQLVMQGLYVNPPERTHGLELSVASAVTGVVPHIEYFCIDPLDDPGVSSSADPVNDACDGGYDSFNGPPMQLESHVPDVDTGGDAWPDASTDDNLIIDDPGTDKWALLVEDDGGAERCGQAYKSWHVDSADSRITMVCKTGSSLDSEFHVLGRVSTTGGGVAVNRVRLSAYTAPTGSEIAVSLVVESSSDGIAWSQLVADTAFITSIGANTLFSMILQMEGTSLKGWVNANVTDAPTVELTTSDSHELVYKHGLKLCDQTVQPDVYPHIEEYCVQLLGAAGAVCQGELIDHFDDDANKADNTPLEGYRPVSTAFPAGCDWGAPLASMMDTTDGSLSTMTSGFEFQLFHSAGDGRAEPTINNVIAAFPGEYPEHKLMLQPLDGFAAEFGTSFILGAKLLTHPSANTGSSCVLAFYSDANDHFTVRLDKDSAQFRLVNCVGGVETVADSWAASGGLGTWCVAVWRSGTTFKVAVKPAGDIGSAGFWDDPNGTGGHEFSTVTSAAGLTKFAIGIVTGSLAPNTYPQVYVTDLCVNSQQGLAPPWE